MRIVIGSDHAGYELKQIFINDLRKNGHTVLDKGADTGDVPANNYHLIGASVAESVVTGDADRGVVICGTGIGISIAANKVPGANCALSNNLFTAKSSRMHNNANIMAIGARIVGDQLALEILRTWLETEYENGRHELRNQNITRIEEKYSKR